MTWNKSHHSRSLNSPREEQGGDKTFKEEDLVNFFSPFQRFSLSLSYTFSITLWPLTYRVIAGGPAGQKAEVRAEMTLGGLSSPVRPGTSVTIRLTTTRTRPSIREVTVVAAVEVGEGKEGEIKTDG